jgi:hypothetical protein
MFREEGKGGLGCGRTVCETRGFANGYASNMGLVGGSVLGAGFGKEGNQEWGEKALRNLSGE